MVLKVGTKAPDFTLKDENNQDVTLTSLLSKGPVVLYFYPKDETPGCTAEACEFRDNWDEITKLGAVVAGVSSDSVESHRKFKEHHNLKHILLSDPEKKVRKAYDAGGLLLPGRVTYVIAQDGTIVHAYESQMNARQHVKEAIEGLKRIDAGAKSPA